MILLLRQKCMCDSENVIQIEMCIADSNERMRRKWTLSKIKEKKEKLNIDKFIGTRFEEFAYLSTSYLEANDYYYFFSLKEQRSSRIQNAQKLMNCYWDSISTYHQAPSHMQSFYLFFFCIFLTFEQITQ